MAFKRKEVENIENRMRELLENKTAKEEFTENVILFILACIGVFEAVQVFSGWLNSINGGPSIIEISVSIGFILVAIAVFIIIHRRKR